jgi:hypothetical protein
MTLVPAAMSGGSDLCWLAVDQLQPASQQPLALLIREGIGFGPLQFGHNRAPRFLFGCRFSFHVRMRN